MRAPKGPALCREKPDPWSSQVTPGSLEYVLEAKWSKVETHKEKTSTKSPSDLRNGDTSEWSWKPEPQSSYGNPFRVSERGNRERKEDGAHLHMSLSKFPLDLIPIPSVEVGLDGDGGPGILLHARVSFFLDVHDERSANVEVAEQGRAGGLRGEHGSVRNS